MKKMKIGSILAGLLLIVLGVGYCGDILSLWNFTLFFDGWWTLFIIVPFACSILNDGYNTFSMLGVIVGVLLLLNAQNIFTQSIFKLAFPVILVLIGLNLIFKNRRCYTAKNNFETYENNEYRECNQNKY